MDYPFTKAIALFSAQKMSHFIFFIIKHHLKGFKFCFTRFCQNAYLNYISHENKVLFLLVSKEKKF